MLIEIIFMSMLGASAQADDSKPLDLPPPPQPLSTSGKKKVSFDSSCTNSVGHKVKSEEVGYDTCLMEAASNKANAPIDQKGQRAGPNTGVSTSTEIKFGK